MLTLPKSLNMTDTLQMNLTVFFNLLFAFLLIIFPMLYVVLSVTYLLKKSKCHNALHAFLFTLHVSMESTALFSS